MKHVPRGVAAHGMEAALHVNKASGHTLADVVRGVPPETHSSEGGGVWAEYLPKAALMSNDLFLDDVNVLVPVWLGGRGDRPAFAMDATGFFGRYLFTVKSTDSSQGLPMATGGTLASPLTSTKRSRHLARRICGRSVEDLWMG